VSEWLWYALWAVCELAFVVAYICFHRELFNSRCEWRNASELWGIDWLDILYRLNREFGVVLTAADFEELPADARSALTAGQLWEVVAAKLRVAGTTPPPDGWQRLVETLSEALSVKRQRITPESRLLEDLGMD
jgi:hypothetical protein